MYRIYLFISNKKSIYTQIRTRFVFGMFCLLTVYNNGLN